MASSTNQSDDPAVDQSSWLDYRTITFSVIVSYQKHWTIHSLYIRFKGGTSSTQSARYSATLHSHAKKWLFIKTLQNRTSNVMQQFGTVRRSRKKLYRKGIHIRLPDKNSWLHSYSSPSLVKPLWSAEYIGRGWWCQGKGSAQQRRTPLGPGNTAKGFVVNKRPHIFDAHIWSSES